MALQNKLKAFVRFDGSGRVIPSSLILQKSKPKVGNWKEINATQCCNDTPGTTTTTTTVNVSQVSGIGSFNKTNACQGAGTSLTLYHSGSLGTGTALFYDANLTNAYQPSSPPSGNGNYVRIYFNAENQVCTMNGNIIQSYEACSSITTTTTSTTDPYFYYIANQYACPDCNTIVGTAMAIKSGTPVTVGSWIPRYIGGNLYYFNVTSPSGPNYMATAVDGGGASSTCGCPA